MKTHLLTKSYLNLLEQLIEDFVIVVTDLLDPQVTLVLKVVSI